MAKCEKILIAGFSGAGKSVFLTKLQSFPSAIGWAFLDLDHLILKKYGKNHGSLAELIESVGWDKFRLWERQELESWLKSDEKGVLALGGGTLTQMVFDLYHPNRKIKICYLHADFKDCWERLHLENSEARPLVQKGKDELEKIYNERQLIFNQIAWKIDNSKETSLSKIASQFWKDILS